MLNYNNSTSVGTSTSSWRLVTIGTWLNLAGAAENEFARLALNDRAASGVNVVSISFCLSPSVTNRLRFISSSLTLLISKLMQAI